MGVIGMVMAHARRLLQAAREQGFRSRGYAGWQTSDRRTAIMCRKMPFDRHVWSLQSVDRQLLHQALTDVLESTKK